MKFIKKLSRKIKIILQQPAVLKIQNNYDKTELRNAKKLIVFLIPEKETVSGGLMSIFSLCKHSRLLVPEACTLVCTYPKRYTYAKNTLFPNDENIWRFNQLLENRNGEELILHLPEYIADKFYDWLNEKQKDFLARFKKVQINILNQNIELMRDCEKWASLFKITGCVTQTTAHDRYATQEICNQYRIPLHHFSVFIDATVPCVAFDKKEKLIVFSPDKNPYTEQVRACITEKLPDYRIVTIKDMTYTQYLTTIAKALIVLSFGEGFDGYFLQPVPVGSLGIAVYNEHFFPDAGWKELKNVYPSFETLMENLEKDVRFWEQNPIPYYDLIQANRQKQETIYSFDGFQDNLRRFYMEKYDFFPEK